MVLPPFYRLFVLMIYKVIDVEFMSVLIPVVIDTSGLSDDDISHDSVDLCKRQCLVVSDLASFALKHESCPESFLLERILVFADLGYQLEEIVIVSKTCSSVRKE